MRLFFELWGLATFVRNIRGAAEDIQDSREAWPDVAERLRLMGTNQIASAGVRGGARYPELKRSTVRFKERYFPGKAILRRTEKMFALVADPLVREEADSVTVTVPLARAAIHQKGGKRGRPAQRKIYEPTPEDEAVIVEIARRASAKKLERRGF